MPALRTPHVLLGGSALLALFALFALGGADALRGDRPVAQYTLTPLPRKGAVRVQLRLEGLRPGRTFLLAPVADPLSGAGPPPENVAIADPHAGGPRMWWGETDGSGRLELDYEVRAHRIDARHALLFGSETFAIPVRSDPRAALFARGDETSPRGSARRITVRFELPSTWDAYTPWGDASPEIEIPEGRFARLRDSFVALGDYVPRRFQAAGAEIQLVTRRADPLREDELQAFLTECLELHERVVGPSLHENLLVIADHPYRGEQAAGRAALNATWLDLSSDPAALEQTSTQRVIAHELFHLWNGGALDLDAPRHRWFAEGVTEYYALRALAASGRLTLGAFANQLGVTLDRLEGNLWADSSLARLGDAYATDAEAWSATYNKGALAAWALDLRLASEGGLDPIVRRIVRRGARPELRRVFASAGEGAETLLDSLSGPHFRAALAGELAAGGLRFVRRSSGFTLGFRSFRPGTMEIVELDPEGPAARRGVRRGDEVLSVNGRRVTDLVALAEAFADLRSPSVEIELWRQGRLVQVRLSPERDYVTQVEAVPRSALATRYPEPGRLGR